jgi:hypothetical protein
MPTMMLKGNVIPNDPASDTAGLAWGTAMRIAAGTAM